MDVRARKDARLKFLRLARLFKGAPRSPQLPTSLVRCSVMLQGDVDLSPMTNLTDFDVRIELVVHVTFPLQLKRLHIQTLRAKMVKSNLAGVALDVFSSRLRRSQHPRKRSQKSKGRLCQSGLCIN